MQSGVRWCMVPHQLAKSEDNLIPPNKKPSSDSRLQHCYQANNIVGVSLSKPHTSRTVLHTCLCTYICLLAWLLVATYKSLNWACLTLIAKHLSARLLILQSVFSIGCGPNFCSALGMQLKVWLVHKHLSHSGMQLKDPSYKKFCTLMSHCRDAKMEKKNCDESEEKELDLPKFSLHFHQVHLLYLEPQHLRRSSYRDWWARRLPSKSK